MMEFKVSEIGWHIGIVDAIKAANDGDTIIVNTQAQLALTKRAINRMCQDAKITIKIREPAPPLTSKHYQSP
jgi:hypothetical protein